jgi:deoxyribodipyrimidine photo-lyase
MRIIHWFRRDLRLIDNPALQWAADNASDLHLVYIHAPDEDAPWQPGAASRWWLHASLGALQAQLQERGQTLVLRSAPSLKTLQNLIQETRAEAISWNRLYEPAAIQRDTAIKAALKEQGLQVYTANSQLLQEPWQISTGAQTPYRVFTPFWRKAVQQISARPIPTPPQLAAPLQKLPSEQLDNLKLHPKLPWTENLSRHWQPGEDQALLSLDTFIDEALADYDKGRDLPARRGTSRLSPHLHWGEIGPQQILAALAEHRDIAQCRFAAELGWREFSHHLLFHFPHTTQQPLNARFSRFPWRQLPACAADYQRWCAGQTGIDFVDAAMQELWQTGWMHNRMRMLAGSLLTKNLGIDWQLGARWFWDTLVDANLASNSLGWQWIAGCGADAAPYFRIFNPQTQAEKFDADGAYRQRWLHSGPQNATPRPAPIVDLKTSRAQALERYAKARAMLATGTD